MARIRIEDLPPVESLTQEELAEIFGAGQRSFRPSFEALESREVTDVGFGHALLRNLAPPPPTSAHIGQVLSPSVEAPQASFQLPPGLLQAAGSRQAEYQAGDPAVRMVTELARTVAEQFQRSVIDTSKIYGWQLVTGYVGKVSGDKFIVQIQFSYGINKGYVDLVYFNQGIGSGRAGTVGYSFSEIQKLDMSNMSPQFMVKAHITSNLYGRVVVDQMIGLRDQVYSAAVDYFKGEYGLQWKPPVDPGLSAKLEDGKFIIEFRMNGPNGQTDRTFRATFTLDRPGNFVCQGVISDGMVPEKLKEMLATVWTIWK